VTPGTEAELEAVLSEPPPALGEMFTRFPGDLLILGAGGKMGPTLALMARRAMSARHELIAVSRFSDPAARARLEGGGVRTLSANLLEQSAVASLPDAANIVFMAGQKFGTRSVPHATWAMNAMVPAFVAERFSGVRTVVFSTGNVYPLTSVRSGGPAEDHPVAPVGEYAMSCLARERVFEHASARHGTPVAIVRLNYAIDLRYGVLVDVARRVRDGAPVDCTMGHVNVIWQGDANSRALRCLGIATSPATVLNLTGAETVSVRWLAREFGARFGVAPTLVGEEAADALLSNAARSFELFGPVTIELGTMIDWTVAWLRRGGPLLDKPTRFEVRDGTF
jgi:nucleoside-diphosphate-sugar epimerase